MMVWFDRENNTGKMAIGGGNVTSKREDYIDVGLTLIIAVLLVTILIGLSVIRSRRIADEEWLTEQKKKGPLFKDSKYNDEETFRILTDYMRVQKHEAKTGEKLYEPKEVEDETELTTQMQRLNVKQNRQLN